jgi:tetratricopeptide (TPR) repeat protein
MLSSRDEPPISTVGLTWRKRRARKFLSEKGAAMSHKEALPVFLLAAIFLAGGCGTVPSHDEGPLIKSVGANGCLEGFLAFDASSVEAINLRPEDLLDDIDIFLREDTAYRILSLSHSVKNISFPASRLAWDLNRIASLPAEKREEKRDLRIAKKVMESSDVFCNEAIPHVLTFLPETTDLNTTVYLTSLSDVSVGVVMDRHIAIPIGHPFYFWSGFFLDRLSVSSLFNVLVHELFHVGYWDNLFLQSEVILENNQIRELLTDLHNEGIATYAAYTASSRYPSPLERDYGLLEDSSKVSSLLEKLNEILKEAESIPEEELLRKRIDVGFGERALNVVGAFMARTIDEKMGRPALVETIVMGPRSFIQTYNSLAVKGSRIHEFEEPRSLTVYQKIKKGVAEIDYDSVRAYLEEIKGEEKRPGGTAGFTLISTGFHLLHQGEADLAVEVFSEHIRLFPENAFGYFGLGESYKQMGEKDLAAESYQRALEMDPTRLYAEKALSELRDSPVGSTATGR